MYTKWRLRELHREGEREREREKERYTGNHRQLAFKQGEIQYVAFCHPTQFS